MTVQMLASVFAFVFGAAIGSFLNVVIWRLPRGESIASPPSRCPSCGAQIRWWQNVPIFSWILLRGRCSRCGVRIDLRYPVVELLTAVMAVACVQVFGVTPLMVRMFVFVALLLALTYIDLDHWILPHALTWPGIVVGLATAGLEGGPGWAAAFLGAGAGWAGFWVIRTAGGRLLGKEALGAGDLWLLAMIGAFLGWRSLLPVVFLASVQGSVVGLLLLAFRGGDRSAGREPAQPATDDADTPPEAEDGQGSADDGQPGPEDSEEEWIPPATAVPFGPFLAVGALEMTFAGDLILDWSMRLLGLR